MKAPCFLPNGTRALAFALIVSLSTAPASRACFGSPIPPTCPRTIFLAKTAPRTVVIPRSGPINVPIGLLPFVSWVKGRVCAQPVAAQVELTLTCTPVGGGMPIVIGPQTFPLPKPTRPGAQPLPGPVTFVIPAGTFAPTGPPHLCTVSGTYTVDFQPGKPGSGTISGTGDVAVCLVPPAPYDSSLPRLHMEYIPTDRRSRDLFQVCRRGDQAVMYFAVVNNDPLESVTLNFSSEGAQVARLPNGFTPGNLQAAYDAGIFSVSDPSPGTDVFPAAFLDTLTPGTRVSEGDPTTPQRIEMNGVLIAPGETRVIGIATRSFGMCANGSCGERFLRADGFFGDMVDGDLALACASTALLVGDRKAKSPLCEFADKFAVSPLVEALFTKGSFGDGGGVFDHMFTHAVGNVPQNVTGGPATKLTGRTLAPLVNPPSQFPNRSAVDVIRLEEGPTFFDYSVQAFPLNRSTSQFAREFNHTIIQQLDALAPGRSIMMPMIVSNPPGNPSFNSFFDVFFEVQSGMLTVTGTSASGAVNFHGLAREFFAHPPAGVGIDRQTFRMITKARGGGLDALQIFARPQGAADGSRAITESGPESFFDVFFTGLTPAPTNQRWRAQLLPLRGAKFGTRVGTEADPVVVQHVTRGTTPNAPLNLSILHVSTPGAINSPFPVPVQTRVLKDVCMIDESDPTKQFSFNMQNGDFRGVVPNGPESLFFSGRGKLKFSGSESVTITGSTPDVIVTGSVTLSNGMGQANIRFRNPLGPPELPIQDTSAFATCP